jgi:hypothetical protein
VDDREFVSAFEACTLPPDLFPHRAHVRLAWLYLREDSVLAALDRFVRNLKRYATSLGAATKYHETITWAYVFLIHERMQRGSFATFEEFAAANEDLFNGILEKYYAKETLASETARATFVMPDLARVAI